MFRKFRFLLDFLRIFRKFRLDSVGEKIFCKNFTKNY